MRKAITFLSKLSDQSALKHRLHEPSITPTKKYFNTIYAKHIAIVSDKDIRALITQIDLL